MKSLRFRVLALVAAFGLLTAVLLAGILFTSVRGYYMDLTSDKSARFIERVLEMHPDLWAAYEKDPSAFSSQLREYVLYSPNTGLYLLDETGAILASAGDPGAHRGAQPIDLAPVRAAFETGSDEPVIAHDPDEPRRRCLVAARPVMRGGQVMGWLYVAARSTDLASHTPELLRSYAVRTAVTVALMTLSLGVLLTLAMMALLTRPLIQLTRVVEGVRDADFAAGVEQLLLPNCGRDDEVGRLSRTFRETFDRLNLEASRARETDARRREMVASVSHDLRTPLTALIGLLDTVRLKGGTMSAAEQADYLARASDNAQHLKRLTDALNELSRLDSPEFRTHPEPIAIGELADDVVQRFMARAREAGLSLALDYPDGLPLTAVDAGLIERALANLIDNALRVTPTGGRVWVRVMREAQGLRLEVSDTGPGVAEEDQPRVFDRFYQTARHRDLRGSSGLGLAIVKRVAELHGGHAGLRSRPGEGATFFIALPSAA
ncbi:MAG: HAMP domain-containing histidine kinase [Betaproteobacteria bacterium]|nr:HAMP domain-containing histidine kinase [Betaproteobacteria bacterium]